ncbi:diacylglycerol kinase [Wenjunlia tyrosinilytica]|uniref:Diacylglycerol kinase n=1 Tax=Wenjunlia tyrosinilytica TaxID=1544741 RepID=A0A917ZMM4_9ACTN|nr:diacylglycerol kinase [Wenjunlia tyrosinilytica]GGO85032.1 diacylglycerol kinase [Wenjunlia tyrosinilytica]
MSAQPPSGDPLLLVIDPAARAADGESVRVAKDVLSACAPVKIALPESTQELDRALAHRGRRRPVVIGDDRALHRVVQALHERRELSTAAVSLVPVGPLDSVPMARALGLPMQAAPAARAAMSGAERSLDLLVDDRGGVVLGAVEIGSCHLGGGGRTNGTRVNGSPGASTDGSSAGGGWWEYVGRGAISLARSLRVPLTTSQLPRLRVEADGVVLADLDRPVQRVAVSNACDSSPGGTDGHPDDGLVEVVVRRASGYGPVRVCARAVTVSGRDFSYAADAELTGPVRKRTWTVQPGAWRLTVPG